MPVPTVIKKNGKTYVKQGKKLILIDRSLSERELIQWLVMQMAKLRKRKRGRRIRKAKQSFLQPPVFTGIKADITDEIRARAADEKKAIQKELDEQNASVLRLKEEIKEDKKLLKAAKSGMHLLPDESKEEIERKHLEDLEEKKYSEADRRKEIKKVEAILADDEIKRKRREEEHKKQLDEERQAASTLMKEREISLKKHYKEKDEFNELLTKKGMKLVAKVEAKYTKWLNGLTIYDLRTLADMSETTFKRDYQLKEILLKELIDTNVIDEAQTKADIIKKDFADQQNELDDLQNKINDIQLKITQLIGQGRKKSEADSTKGMSDDQIVKAMAGHKEFLGVFAADEMPTKFLRPNIRQCWIMNTDVRGKPGEHWVAFLIDTRPHGSHSVEYYDSLADPISTRWMKELKTLIPKDRYLRFKQNNIADQNDDSSNCGEFCVRFLKARINGETFGKASGWDALGEKNIEKWKKHHQKLWLSGQAGEGLRDIYDKVRAGAKHVIQRIKDTLSGPREGPSPAVRGWLAKYGNEPIISITVCKKPVYSWIERIGNWVSSGQMRDNMDRLGYERMMHLYMIVRLEKVTVKIEKNQIVEIKQSSDVGESHMSVPETVKGTPFTGTCQELFDAAQKIHGAKLWQYHLVTQNCQKFVLWFLGGLVTPAIREFVDQDVAETLKDMGLLQKIATVATDIAATADVALNGKGVAKYQRDDEMHAFRSGGGEMLTA